jgi:hypothetical protein
VVIVLRSCLDGRLRAVGAGVVRSGAAAARDGAAAAGHSVERGRRIPLAAGKGWGGGGVIYSTFSFKSPTAK